MQKSWKVSAVLVVLCLAILMSGCYGTFSLTRKLHNWNGTADGQWGNEGLFLLLSPIYVICVVGDSLIFNSIEFWGGDNPIPGTAQNGSFEVDQVACAVGLPFQVSMVESGPTAR